jgi:hypothetical protein
LKNVSATLANGLSTINAPLVNSRNMNDYKINTVTTTSYHEINRYLESNHGGWKAESNRVPSKTFNKTGDIIWVCGDHQHEVTSAKEAIVTPPTPTGPISTVHVQGRDSGIAVISEEPTGPQVMRLLFQPLL